MTKSSTPVSALPWPDQRSGRVFPLNLFTPPTLLHSTQSQIRINLLIPIYTGNSKPKQVPSDMMVNLTNAGKKLLSKTPKDQKNKRIDEAMVDVGIDPNMKFKYPHELQAN